ncbi:hypothetical protein [Accumulibacter sp.]|uniref:hypothetical protein n=1 Tax=Accumulibacter sp. TaxID=2053492 RepID=UPI002633D53A|nr:hypothetical protein [Accumulibacter sp.]
MGAAEWGHADAGTRALAGVAEGSQRFFSAWPRPEGGHVYGINLVFAEADHVLVCDSCSHGGLANAIGSCMCGSPRFRRYALALLTTAGFRHATLCRCSGHRDTVRAAGALLN